MIIFFWGNSTFSNCYFFQSPPLSEWVIYSVENFIKAWQAKRGIDLQFPVDRSTNIVSWLNYSHVWELDGNFIGEINTIHSAVQTHSDGLIINVNGLVFTTKLTVSSTETVNPDGDSHGQHGINKFIFTNDDELCLSAAWMSPYSGRVRERVVMMTPTVPPCHWTCEDRLSSAVHAHLV